MWTKGYSDFNWLRAQALDEETMATIDLIESDELAFHQRGVVTRGDEEFVLRFKQGTFYTVRKTGHTIANIFPQIFKNNEHVLLEDFFKDANLVLDIGANEGYYALNLLNKNSKARIIAVEPNIIAFNLLKKNIQINGMEDRIEAINKAIWTERGSVDLNILPEVTSVGAVSIVNGSFMEKITGTGRIMRQRVDTLSLDDLVSVYSLNHVDVMKIDIEGAEFDVLSSSTTALSVINRVVVEYHHEDLKAKVRGVLRKKGFKEVLHAPDRVNFGDLYFEKS